MAITLRCTQVVRRRLQLARELPETPPATTALGDWYVNLIRFGRQQIIMATSERSLLTVFVSARQLRELLLPSLQAVVLEVLIQLGVPVADAQAEVQAMDPASFGVATNRRVLGSMNQLVFDASWATERISDPVALALHLADTPMSALGAKKGAHGWPDKVTRQLMELRYAKAGASH